MIGEIEKDIEEMVRERCRDCVALVEENGIWVCDERERPCIEVTVCPEGLE